jgi:hypothetical protein
MEKIWLCSAKPAPACGAPNCPVPRLALRRSCRSREKGEDTAAKIHRTVQCAPDCPVSQRRPRQRSAVQSASDAWRAPMVSWSHRTVSGAPTGPKIQRLGAPIRKEIGHRTTIVHVRWCTRLSGAPPSRRQELLSNWISNGS